VYSISVMLSRQCLETRRFGFELQKLCLCICVLVSGGQLLQVAKIAPVLLKRVYIDKTEVEFICTAA
jgi:hypothetical protein